MSLWIEYIVGIYRNAYKGIDDDILWFGDKNIEPVTNVMKEAGFNRDEIVKVTNDMWNYIRLVLKFRVQKKSNGDKPIKKKY